MSKSSPDSMSPLNWDNIISKHTPSIVSTKTRSTRQSKKCNNGEYVNDCCNSSDKCQFIKDGNDNVEKDICFVIVCDIRCCDIYNFTEVLLIFIN